MGFADLIREAPGSPGVYQFLDEGSKILYVGKAKDLRARLRSYQNPDAAGLGPRKRRLLTETRQVRWIVTRSELEAFVLEANIIKRERPPFNVLLRDDKAYPCLRLTIREDWPRLEVVRRFARDGSLYFGPYVPATGLREILRFIRRAFPIRLCRKPLERPSRPCLQHQMGRCMGPCAGDVDRNDYLRVVGEVRKFLEGKRSELLDGLRRRMWEASRGEDYETAAVLRDRISAIEGAWERQHAVSTDLGDLDVFGFAFREAEAAACVLFIRGGKIVGSRDWVRRLPDKDHGDLIGAWLFQFYSRDLNLPDEVITPKEFEGMGYLSSWLSERRGRKVMVRTLVRGERAALLRMAEENAHEAFSRAGRGRESRAIGELARVLGLEREPGTIHCFDISTHAGTESVGSRVAWKDGGFSPADYRHYRIRTVVGMNDFAMIEEVLRRSYREEAPPDLIVVDGGRGQLESALRGLHGAAGGQAHVVALAKERPGRPERVYTPGRSRSLPLMEGSPGTLLLKRIRDEAHRFAITYQRERQRRSLLHSPLSDIPGIGPARRMALLKAYGSLDAIRRAPLAELASLPAMNRRVAEDLKSFLGSSSERGGGERRPAEPDNDH